jgi:hypothetical protein
MRNILLILTFISSISFAQTGINYQGAATDSQGNKLENQPISLKTSILQGGVEGSASYSETHYTTTDQFGLFNVIIGLGEVLTGSFDSIQWGADAHYLKVELDATGGTDYNLVSTTQMMSVPYAKYAENAGIDSAMVAEMINQALENNVNGIGIGDYFQGGIVAYIFDEDDAGYVEGEVHGYIISNETYDGIWGCNGIANNINGQNGLENSISISNLCPSSTNQVGGGSCSSISSAEYWLNYSNSGYDDWFLPSFYEVSKFDWSNIFIEDIGVILVSNDYNAGGFPSWNGLVHANQYHTTSGTYDFTSKTSCTKSLGFRIF